MAHALMPASQSPVLETHASLGFTSGSTEYQIQRLRDQVIYSVQRGKERLTVPIQWAFGVGNTGQTYVYLNGGILYEARVSFYRSLGGLAITNGHSQLPDTTIAEAAGRPLSEDETTRCFGCHVTSTGDDFQQGIHCQACHPESEQHATSLASGGKPAMPAHLAALTSLDMANFCGKCHRTYENVERSGVKGIENVRFQPYRLAKSRCFIPNDKRISCVGCHNPHEEVHRNATFYDAKCKSCHAPALRSGKNIAMFAVCPVAKQNCTSCHMPKVEVPEMHDTFTDHRIRVVHEGELYPG